MKITELELENFRAVHHMILPFEPDLNVLHGMNGSGKSGILQALTLSLSWAAARMRKANGSGRPISVLDIRNQAASARLRLSTTEVSWQLARARSGRASGGASSDLKALSNYAENIRQKLEMGQGNFPVVVSYPVHRAVLDVPLRIRTRHDFHRLDALDGSLDGGADFRRFFEWFREREDLENERFREQGAGFQSDSQLNAVRRALTIFLPGFTHLAVKRKPLRMVVSKHGEELRIDQLSDGEKILMALIGDLSRRLAIANPNLSDPLHGHGIVLVDEVDLHLHPSWQSMAATRLKSTFPNCQFILSTHSNQVLGELPARCIRRLFHAGAERGVCYGIPKQSLGLAANEVLENLMDAPIRDEETTSSLKAIFHAIDHDEFSNARAQIQDLETRLEGAIPETLRASAMITMLADEEDES